MTITKNMLPLRKAHQLMVMYQCQIIYPLCFFRVKNVELHCVERESVRIQSFSGPYFPTFGQITEIYKVNLGI